MPATRKKTRGAKGLARVLGTRAHCYAASLGECAGSLEKEHPISEAALTLGEIRFESSTRKGDGPWTRSRVTPAFRRADASGPVLCAKHNRDLSAIDRAGIGFARFLRAVTDAKSLAAEHPGVGRFNAHQVARWFCKIGVGTFALNGVECPEALIRYLFGAREAPRIWILAGLRREREDQQIFVVDYFGTTTIRTFFEGQPVGGAFAVARGPVEFIFSDREPDQLMRDHLSPFASWEERPPRIQWAPTDLSIQLDWGT